MLKIALYAINIILFLATCIYAVLGIYEQVMGPGDLMKLLRKLRIRLSYTQCLLIGLSCFILFLFTRTLIKELYG